MFSSFNNVFWRSFWINTQRPSSFFKNSCIDIHYVEIPHLFNQAPLVDVWVFSSECSCYMTRSVQKVSSHVLWKNRDVHWRRHKKHSTQDNDTSVPFKVGTLGPYTVLPVAISCLVIFSWISLAVWNLFLFKGDFSFGKSLKSQGTKSGLQGAVSHLGDLMFHKKNSAQDA